MEEQHEKVYFSLMAKKKLQEKYKDKTSFGTTSGKMTPIALLQKHDIINEKVSETDDAEGIMKTTAKLRPIFILPQKILRTQWILTTCITSIYQGTRKITSEAEFSIASYFGCVEAKNNFAFAIWASYLLFCCCRQPNVITVA